MRSPLVEERLERREINILRWLDKLASQGNS